MRPPKSPPKSTAWHGRVLPVIAREPDAARPVFCIVCVGVRPADSRGRKPEAWHHHTRNWGWFPTMREARQRIRSRDCARFMHECGYYQWCLVEWVPAGICSDTLVMEWYKLKGERYVKARRPPFAKHICNWSMG